MRETKLREEQFWLVTVSLLVLAIVALGVTLIYTRGVMIPFVLAVFVTTMVSPIVDYQVVRWKFPRAIAISAALLVVLAMMAVLGFLLIGAVQQMVATAGQYTESFKSLADSLFGEVKEKLPDGWEAQIDYAAISKDLAGRLPGIVGSTMGTATGLLSNGFLILVFVVFLLAGRKPHAIAAGGIYGQIEATIRRYITTKFVLSAITGTLVWAILSLFGLQMASLFGMLAFLLNFIPSVGSVIATLLPIPVAVAQFESAGMILGVIAAPGAVQMAIGNVLEPKIMGEGLKLHPVTILLSLAFWGLLWGPIGMVLAAPIVATIRIILIQFATTRPAGDLLAGQLPQPTGENDKREEPADADGDAPSPDD